MDEAAHGGLYLASNLHAFLSLQTSGWCADDWVCGRLQAAEDVDTDDDKDEEQEFELWKKREKARIKRDRDERELAQKVVAEREMLRGMSEEERRAWERANQKASRVAVLEPCCNA